MSSTETTQSAVPRRGGGARRGGRFGGKPLTGNAISAAAARPDDTEAVRNLRAKYADKLVLLREMFSDWTDEDLLFALQEAGGEVELAVGRISEGHAEQFNSVKSKKQAKKDASLSTATPTSFHGQHGGNTNGTATILTSSRSGRGGANAARGGRGGGAVRGARGGGRGAASRGTGRGGASGVTTSDVNGEASSNVPVASTSTGSTWADAVAATSSSKNGGAWEDDTEGLNLKAQKPVEEESVPAAIAPKADPVEESNKEETKQAGPIVSAIQKVTSKLVPKSSKLSWAQVARPAEPAKEQNQPPKEAPTAPAAHRAQNTTKSSEPKAVETTSAAAAAPIAAPVAETESTIEPEQAPSSTAAIVEEADPVSAPVPSAPAAEETSSTAAAVRPAAGRSVQSQRALQRAKQDAPVVMPGGNAQLDNLGMRFGGLSFLGGDQADAAVEPQQAAVQSVEQAAPAAAATTTATPASAAVPTHQDAFAQATSPQNFNDKETYSAHQQGYQQGLQQHQQAHQAAVNQAQAQHQAIAGLPNQQASQAQQQPEQQTNQYQQATSTGYNGQVQQQQNQAQTQTQAPQTTTGAQQGTQQSYGDYASMYGGLDAQRLAGYYGAYDNNAAARGNEDRSAFGSQAVGEAQQSTNAAQTESAQPHIAPQQQQQQQPQQQQQQQQQQQFPNMMPYYYPQFYLPNQFQHFGQPAAGYGQYALYGGQPQQHPNKPNTPASLQSPYAQSLPHNDNSSSNPYGNSGNVSQYSQSPANTSALSSSAYTDYSRGGNTADYSKLYGSNNNNGSIANTGSSIPGLSGFLGQQPSNGNSGTGTQNKSQSTANTANTTSLDNAYRQYDNSKIGGPSPVRQGSAVGVTGNQAQQLNGQAGTQSQTQNLQSQQPQQPQQAQQHQHYYQQYNAYAGHQQPNNASANYASYPYRQYWGQ